MIDKISEQNKAIIDVLSLSSEGMSRGQIMKELSFSITDKTLQRRLMALVRGGQVGREGEKRATRYFLIRTELKEPTETYLSTYKDTLHGIFSKESLKALIFFDLPLYARPKVSYSHIFLENYVPNEAFYVPIEIRKELTEQGRRIETVFVLALSCQIL